MILLQEYKLALWQCYERCLQHYGPVSVEEICNVDLFQSVFFPGGFEAEDACFTVSHPFTLILKKQFP